MPWYFYYLFFIFTFCTVDMFSSSWPRYLHDPMNVIKIQAEPVNLPAKCAKHKSAHPERFHGSKVLQHHLHLICRVEEITIAWSQHDEEWRLRKRGSQTADQTWESTPSAPEASEVPWLSRNIALSFGCVTNLHLPTDGVNPPSVSAPQTSSWLAPEKCQHKVRCFPATSSMCNNYCWWVESHLDCLTSPRWSFGQPGFALWGHNSVTTNKNLWDFGTRIGGSHRRPRHSLIKNWRWGLVNQMIKCQSNQMRCQNSYPPPLIAFTADS